MAANSVFIGSQTSSSGGSATNFFSTVASATTTLTGNQAAVDVTGKNRLLCNNATLLTIQGLLGGVEGQQLNIISIGAGQVDLVNQSGSASAGNKLTNIATSAPSSLSPALGNAVYQYINSTWVLVNHEQGDWIDRTFTAGDFTASTGTWTLTAGDQVSFKYLLRGKTLTVEVWLTTTTLSNNTANLKILIPGGFTAPNQAGVGNASFTTAGPALGNALVFTLSDGFIWLQRDFSASLNFIAGTDNTGLTFTASFEVN